MYCVHSRFCIVTVVRICMVLLPLCWPPPINSVYVLSSKSLGTHCTLEKWCWFWSSVSLRGSSSIMSFLNTGHFLWCNQNGFLISLTIIIFAFFLSNEAWSLFFLYKKDSLKTVIIEDFAPCFVAMDLVFVIF